MPRKLPRRLLNPSTLGLSGALAGIVLVGLSLLPQLSREIAIPIGFLLAVCVLLLLVALGRQPLSIRFEAEAFVIRYPVKRRRVPYQSVERLHFHRLPTGLGGGRSKDTLMIELRDGHFLKLDYMKGQLRRIRGYLEKQVYGPSV